MSINFKSKFSSAASKIAFAAVIIPAMVFNNASADNVYDQIGNTNCAPVLELLENDRESIGDGRKGSAMRCFSGELDDAGRPMQIGVFLNVNPKDDPDNPLAKYTYDQIGGMMMNRFKQDAQPATYLGNDPTSDDVPSYAAIYVGGNHLGNYHVSMDGLNQGYERAMQVQHRLTVAANAEPNPVLVASK